MRSLVLIRLASQDGGYTYGFLSPHFSFSFFFFFDAWSFFYPLLSRLPYFGTLLASLSWSPPSDFSQGVVVVWELTRYLAVARGVCMVVLTSYHMSTHAHMIMSWRLYAQTVQDRRDLRSLYADPSKFVWMYVSRNQFLVMYLQWEEALFFFSLTRPGDSAEPIILRLLIIKASNAQTLILFEKKITVI